MKKHLNKQTLKIMKERIEELKSNIINEMQDEKFETAIEVADCATREVMLTLQFNKKKRRIKILNEIKIALRKINQGTYGICEAYNEPIDSKRLEANPLTRYSFEAQQELEEERQLHYKVH